MAEGIAAVSFGFASQKVASGVAPSVVPRAVARIPGHARADCERHAPRPELEAEVRGEVVVADPLQERRATSGGAPASTVCERSAAKKWPASTEIDGAMIEE